jgi:aspartyl protease family protein
MKQLYSLLICLCLLVAPLALAAPDVVVKGLFKGRAVLVVNGQTHLLKDGQTSPEGVKLISSSSKEAVVEIDGKTRVLNLSRHIGAQYRAAEFAEVRIPRGPDSHYWVSGIINGRRVDMMVDTGATFIAMNINEAQRLGIDYRNGVSGKIQTAGGIVDHFMVTLERVAIGNITVHQVEAAVLVGDFPQQILLGNSLLRRVEMKQEAGLLVLRQKM